MFKMPLTDTVEKEFNARKFVKKALTIPPNLAGMTRNSMIVDRLMLQIEEAVAYCFDQLEKQDLGDDSEYGKAIQALTKKHAELKAKYPGAYRTGGNGKAKKGKKPYNASYFGVVNGDGLVQATYTN